MTQCPKCSSVVSLTLTPRTNQWVCMACGFSWHDRYAVTKYSSAPFIAPKSAVMAAADCCSICNSWSCTCASADPFKQMQDDAAKRWQELPRSVRLTYYLLAKAEFQRCHDVSYEIEKAWKVEHA